LDSVLEITHYKLLNYQIAGEINEQSRALAADLSKQWTKDT